MFSSYNGFTEVVQMVKSIEAMKWLPISRSQVGSPNMAGCEVEIYHALNWSLPSYGGYQLTYSAMTTANAGKSWMCADTKVTRRFGDIERCISDLKFQEFTFMQRKLYTCKKEPQFRRPQDREANMIETLQYAEPFTWNELGYTWSLPSRSRCRIKVRLLSNRWSTNSRPHRPRDQMCVGLPYRLAFAQRHQENLTVAACQTHELFQIAAAPFVQCIRATQSWFIVIKRKM